MLILQNMTKIFISDLKFLFDNFKDFVKPLGKDFIDEN